MRILLIANTLFEAIIGIVMIFFSTSFLQDGGISITIARVLGCNALALATLSGLMQGLTETNQLRPGLIALLVFHVTVTVAQTFNLIDGTVPLPVIIVHSLFAAAFLFFLNKQRQ